MKINAYSARCKDNINLVLGEQFYGDIGNLLGINKLDNGTYAAYIEVDNKIYSRSCILDFEITLLDNIPTVSSKIFMGPSYELSDNISNYLKSLISRDDSIKDAYCGGIDTNIFFNNTDNSVYVIEEDLFYHLEEVKKNNPSLPIKYALNIDPYLKDDFKKMN